MSTSYPSSKQTFTDPTIGSDLDPAPVAATMDTVAALEDRVGYTGDTASAAGSITAQIADLQAKVADRVRASADVSLTSTTLAAVTGLSAAVTAGQTYSVEALLFVTADGAAGQSYAVDGTATLSAGVYDVVIGDLDALASPAAGRCTALAEAVSLAGNGNTTFSVVLRGVLTIATGGTLAVYAGLASGTGTLVVGRGSTWRVTEVP